jgi:hypothetical protein
MADQEEADQVDEATTVFYGIDDGDAVGRLEDGWNRQVWRPSLGEWVDADIDFATEGREITKEEAEKRIGSATFGEFAPEQEGNQPT